jgi:hypothetical protein
VLSDNYYNRVDGGRSRRTCSHGQRWTAKDSEGRTKSSRSFSTQLPERKQTVATAAPFGRILRRSNVRQSPGRKNNSDSDGIKASCFQKSAHSRTYPHAAAFRRIQAHKVWQNRRTLPLWTRATCLTGGPSRPTDQIKMSKNRTVLTWPAPLVKQYVHK